MTSLLPERVATPPVDMLWLDITRKCQLECGHCYNESGPDGGHGQMSSSDWCTVIDQAVLSGVRRIQVIGGEPTLHPDMLAIVGHALDAGLDVEVYSNLVHVTDRMWKVFRRPGMSLATSYYSSTAAEHDAMTNRRSHARTRANIAKAVSLGIRLRVGIVAADDTAETRRDLEAMGVAPERIRVDRIREFGRAGQDHAPAVENLCGNCGTGKAAVGPDGRVSPCVFSAGWMTVGTVPETPLADILTGPEMAQATATIRTTVRDARGCDPDEECTPGGPLSGCNPRY
ncbi:radical SAM/SPASM domain-containing protein [Nocardiopsis trehalosi]|uniref:radical SAM/SPASM domain-containing protein n=1 Tax=Nocardiopsis trehalosi TaxID=109329 RepID=UPI00082EC8F9|nr:radical SAM/SPASM domain-containing protein [Nocardiopsis trehalosi]